jgi:type II secretory pathway pseudopilin PulG
MTIIEAAIAFAIVSAFSLALYPILQSALDGTSRARMEMEAALLIQSQLELLAAMDGLPQQSRERIGESFERKFEVLARLPRPIAGQSDEPLQVWQVQLTIYWTAGRTTREMSADVLHVVHPERPDVR